MGRSIKNLRWESGPQAVPYRDVFGSTDEVARNVVITTRELDGVESGQQLAKKRPQFHPRQMSAQAKVHADPEGELLVSVGPSDVEAKWIFEDRFVAIGRKVGEQYSLACPDGGRTQRVVFLGVSQEMPDGRYPADDLVGRIVDELRVVLQQAKLLGMSDQRTRPPASELEVVSCPAVATMT